MIFLETEKRRYQADKASATWLTGRAKAPGLYRGSERGFCIPPEYADENLFEGIRTPLSDYWRNSRIKWHDETAAGPSNHLCSSMVCGINFLAPLMDQPRAATIFLSGIYGDEVATAVPVAASGPLVEFEWVGNSAVDYINEGINRTRGANATSADAAMAYRRPDGGKSLVLIEWKYTEHYRSEDKGADSKGEERARRYKALVQDARSPFDPAKVSYEELLFEPFYQFMRQVLLAWRMSQEGTEFGADAVRVLHLSPRANSEFGAVTSPRLAARYPDKGSTALFRSVLRDQSIFSPLYVEDAFAPLLGFDGPEELAVWSAYIKERYPWAKPKPASIMARA